MTAIIILAAGHGTRMNSMLPKVLHSIAGRPLIEWSVRIAAEVSERLPVVVVGHGKEQVRACLGDRVDYATQEQQLGTGHAVQQAELTLQNHRGPILVIYGDMPLLTAQTLRDLAHLYTSESAGGDLAIAMLTVVRDDPQGFGRIVRDEQGNIQAIVEEADCTAEQKQIRELNPGVYCFNSEWLWANLASVPLSAKGEYYLTDLVDIAVSQKRRVVSMTVDDAEVAGINTRVHLANAAAIMRQRILERHMLAGVTIVDPTSTYIDDTVEIGPDTVIEPGCMLQGETQIGTHCVIGPNTQIVDSVIGNHCAIAHSVIEKASIADQCDVGPFTHLRSGATLDTGVHIGNFGEIKNSYLGPRTKMGHFSYIGDAHVEADVNIGAGTITCNYDGQSKHRTQIGRGAFIGSDTLLVAPVNLGDDSRTGAGSVVTRDVPARTLVYGIPAKIAQSQTNRSTKDRE